MSIPSNSRVPTYGFFGVKGWRFRGERREEGRAASREVLLCVPKVLRVVTCTFDPSLLWAGRPAGVSRRAPCALAACFLSGHPQGLLPAALRGANSSVGRAKALIQPGLILAPLVPRSDNLGPFRKRSTPLCPHASTHLEGCKDYRR